MWEWIALATLVLAGVPALMALINLACFRAPRRSVLIDDPPVSILIPARNEEATIGAAVEAALASRHIGCEVVVMDDHSHDGTADVVGAIAARDPRVRLVAAPPLPAGWCGKQHACHALASAARHPYLLFVDADVRLEPDGVARMLGEMHASGADLLSGVPRQITRSPGERLVVPLIHFVLLGFLPIPRMRRSPSPSYAAGCGQLFLARRAAYERFGGHGAIRASRHDGIALPRAFRRAGLRTDLCDATTVATCRMYRSGSEVWQGFGKNATEGMAAPAAIVPWTVLLIGGQVLPPLLLAAAWLTGAGPEIVKPALVATALGFATRFALTLRFRQSWTGALLHPLGVAVVVAIQWHALARRLAGRQFAWKGRVPVESR